MVKVIWLQVLRTSAARICFSILWLAALLAVFGGAWRRLPDLSVAQAGGATLLLTLWSLCLLGLYRFLHQDRMDEKNVSTEAQGRWTGIKNHLVQNNGILVPVLFLGCILPTPWQILYLLLIVFVELLWGRFGVTDSKTELLLQREPKQTSHPTPLPPRPSPLAPDSEEEDLSEMSLDEGTVQQIVRSRTEAGTDHFEGTFLIEFQEQQWTQSIHIPFCPAFEGVPKIDAYLLEEVPAKIKTPAPQVYGVRIDVKRAPTAPDRFHVLVVAQYAVK